MKRILLLLLLILAGFVFQGEAQTLRRIIGMMPKTSSGGGGGAAAVSFENANGFSVSGNSVSRISSGGYFGTVDTVETLAADGNFSFKLNTNLTGLTLKFSDGTGTYEFRGFGSGSVDTFYNGAYEATGALGTIGAGTIFKIERIAGVVRFYKDTTLLLTFASTSSGAAELFVTAQNDSDKLGTGINTVTKG